MQSNEAIMKNSCVLVKKILLANPTLFLRILRNTTWCDFLLENPNCSYFIHSFFYYDTPDLFISVIFYKKFLRKG